MSPQEDTDEEWWYIRIFYEDCEYRVKENGAWWCHNELHEYPPNKCKKEYCPLKVN